MTLGYIITNKNGLYFTGIKHDLLSGYAPGTPTNRLVFKNDIQRAYFFTEKEVAMKVAKNIDGVVWLSNSKKPRTMHEVIMLGNRLSKHMEINGLKAIQIARTIDVPAREIIRLLKGHVDITFKHADAIQHYLDNN
ncbi:hypothetical protein SAMN05421767_10643 [Granulicatella balaenopterae]|uniref:Uncharacterized protein n=1 Tax=Granulicatella balaenopterae TaxID=137733 RepID=A0A1H9INQ5_9LACT|nr:helix-turn-helix transcriptional regulator [Granulicatella balaenopterae]SEQ76224.1 hypothetical protein SAMN05421767_10643 [Granulicatella balaenopterae]